VSHHGETHDQPFPKRRLDRAAGRIRGASGRASTGSDLPAAAQRRAGTGGFEPPRTIKDVKPTYPALAQRARVNGAVLIEGIIGVDGRVQCTRVMKSVPQLDQAALDAVGQWESSPTIMAGTPVPTQLTMSVNFTLQ
jgi:periplasmic protein TonB